MSENKIHNLRRCGSDPRVKKTLIRNTERRLTSPEPGLRCLSPEKKPSVIAAGLSANLLVAAGSSLQRKVRYNAGKGDGSANSRLGASIVEKLDKPKLCSSLALHKYIEQVKLSQPSTMQLQNLEIDAKIVNEKVSKRLNFPSNEIIYKNLIPLNDSKTQTTLQKNLSSTHSTRRTFKLKLSQREIEAAIDNIFSEDLDEKIHLQLVPFQTKQAIATTELYKNVRSFEDLSSSSDISD